VSSIEVTITTGMWRSAASDFTCSSTAKPSISGITTSSRRTSTLAERRRSSAEAPSSAVVTRCPSRSSAAVSISRITGSSSTTRIDARSFMRT
jgi:hypothetical protein